MQRWLGFLEQAFWFHYSAQNLDHWCCHKLLLHSPAARPSSPNTRRPDQASANSFLPDRSFVFT
jgi:hypothetical protein